ncbi:MAG TPA: hypothetical protein VGL47_21690 [Amycolatopsis sp.]|uniref:hypothetical protein n=1 Tax=Amycolatopsis sp. TaxID=37632 RepID=UPI002F422158
MRGGTPAVRNVAANVVFPPTPLVRDQDIVLLPLPANGTLSAGPVPAGPGASAVAGGLPRREPGDVAAHRAGSSSPFAMWVTWISLLPA